ncbi:unnamed protein product [Prorocentrum cordatum]|uniref:Uncharacterized protein n=1 Tax=Prorocentrum cordatum TaxID=2364126 RepID=A0ABN9T8V7_9DINO|nr:unnamed protein product [Polarella glacialis]
MIADGKLQPPSWGFFNHRHAERYNVLRDFATNFQRQLVSTPANPRGAPSRSPFTSERAHRDGTQRGSGSGMSKPDGGALKRVQSQPSMTNLSLLGADRGGQRGGGPLARAVLQAQGEGGQPGGDGGGLAARAATESRQDRAARRRPGPAHGAGRVRGRQLLPAPARAALRRREAAPRAPRAAGAPQAVRLLLVVRRRRRRRRERRRLRASDDRGAARVSRAQRSLALQPSLAPAPAPPRAFRHSKSRSLPGGE